MKKSGCLICGKDLIYKDENIKIKCEICNKEHLTKVACEDNHYICDRCHSKKGIDNVLNFLIASDSKNPIYLIDNLMKDPFIYMHGPEHHIMVGASLLTAFYNSGGEIDLEESLEEMKDRGKNYPGGSCGFWGSCGAAVSVGMFLSIITNSNPLSKESWGLINKGTGKCLQEIGELGGPRCCKRNSFTSILEGAKYTEENFRIKMEIPSEINCEYYFMNSECQGKKCPYFPKR